MEPPRYQLESDDTKLDLVRYLRVVWRRKLFVLLPVLFVTSITAVGVRFLSPLYVSSAKINLEPRTRVTRELERQIVDERRKVRRKDQIAKIRAQISGRDFLESVIRELGLHNDPSIQARAQFIHETRTPDVPVEEIAMRILVRGLRSKIKVKNAGANTFMISVQDNDPGNAYLLAKVITRSFVDEVKRERMEKLGELFKFSSRQTALYRQKLEDAEKELQDFQAQLIRERSLGSPVTVSNVNQAKSHLRRLQLDVEQAQQRLQGLREMLAQVLDPLPDVKDMRRDPEVRSLERRLVAAGEEELLTTLERMRASGTPTPAEFDVRGTLRSQLRRRLTEMVDERYPNIETFYRDKITEYALEAIIRDAEAERVASLEKKLQVYAQRVEGQPEKELKLRALEEKVAAARDNLETFARSVQNAQLSEAILTTQLGGGVNIVDPPEKPTGPVRPNKKRLVVLAFLLALMSGLGSIFAVEYLDKSFKDIDEIERVLGLHVIGTLPRVTEGLPFGDGPGNRKRRALLATSFALLLVVLGGMALYERLLRKQQVAVPQARIEAILQGERAVGASEDPAPALEDVPWLAPGFGTPAGATPSDSSAARVPEAAPGG